MFAQGETTTGCAFLCFLLSLSLCLGGLAAVVVVAADEGSTMNRWMDGLASLASQSEQVFFTAQPKLRFIALCEPLAL